MIINAAELKRRNLLRLAGVRDKKIYIGPKIVVLKINNSCNLRCRYCWVHSPGNPAHLEPARQVSWEEFLSVAHDSVELKVDEFEITGGEPTMHPLFRDMMRHLEQQPIKVKVFTNATFPLDYCEDVLKADHIIVDLGAVNRQQYLAIHGKDVFDRVIDNIKRLVSLRDAGKPSFIIEIAYIMNALNINEADLMQDLASKLDVNSIYYTRVSLNEYNREMALPATIMSGPQDAGKETPPACLNGWFNMIVRFDGNFSICCQINRMRFCDFGTMSLKAVWLSKRMMNMRLLGKYGQIQKMFKGCHPCPFYKDNMKRLRALARQDNKKINP